MGPDVTDNGTKPRFNLGFARLNLAIVATVLLGNRNSNKTSKQISILSIFMEQVPNIYYLPIDDVSEANNPNAISCI